MIADFFASPRPDATAADIFAKVLRRVLTVWLIAMCVLALGFLVADSSGIDPSFTQPRFIGQLLMISIASGLVSVFALVPGLCLKQTTPTRIADDVASRNLATTQLVLVGSVAAMSVRFVGTIALFAACRYQFELTSGMLAFAVCGWYVLLTSAEIFWLARSANAIDSFRNSQTPLTDSSVG